MLTVVGWRLARYEDLLRSMETLHQTLLRGRDKMPAPIRWLRHRGWTDYRQLEGLDAYWASVRDMHSGGSSGALGESRVQWFRV
eukprot:s7463_g3.t2